MQSYKLVVISFILISTLLPNCQQKNDPFEGTWIMVTGKYESPELTVISNKEKRTCFKILANGHFGVVEMCKAKPDSNFFAAVGTYSFDDSTYTETYEASNVGYQIGTSLKFKYTLDKNFWRIKMNTKNMKLYEEWMKQN